MWLETPDTNPARRPRTWIKAPVVKVPLLKDKGFAHDVKAMAAVKNAGLIYICNPNNPSGTMTSAGRCRMASDEQARWGSIVMLDEAYTHIVPDAYFCSDLVAKDKDIIILRTFSKIYGLAGLRAGAVFARPDLMAKISGWTGSLAWSSPSIAGMAAAHASLQSKTLIPERKAKIGKVRDDLFNYFEKNKFKYIPSVSNCVHGGHGQGWQGQGRHRRLYPEPRHACDARISVSRFCWARVAFIADLHPRDRRFA